MAIPSKREMMAVANPVIDNTPVSGDGTAIQSYLDISLSKEDIVQSVLDQQSIELEKQLEDLKEEEQVLENEKNQLKRDGRKAIKQKLVKKHGSYISKMEKYFGEEGDFDFNDGHYKLENGKHSSFYNECTWSYHSDTGQRASAIYKERNSSALYGYKRKSEISDLLDQILEKQGDLRREIDKIQVAGKQVRLDLAKSILQRTEQGKELLSAMSMQRIASKTNKQLGLPTKKKAISLLRGIECEC